MRVTKEHLHQENGYNPHSQQKNTFFGKVPDFEKCIFSPGQKSEKSIYFHNPFTANCGLQRSNQNQNSAITTSLYTNTRFSKKYAHFLGIFHLDKTHKKLTFSPTVLQSIAGYNNAETVSKYKISLLSRTLRRNNHFTAKVPIFQPYQNYFHSLFANTITTPSSP